MPKLSFTEVQRMTVIPPPEEWSRTSFTLPKKLLAALDDDLREVNADRPIPERLSRDRLVQLYLEWATRERRAEKKAKR